MQKFILSWTVVMSIIAFACYGVDKHKAIKHNWRISERTLILLAYAGGAYGAFIGMYVFHHKTRHLKFRILIPLSVLLWTGIVIVVIRGINIWQ